MFYRKRNAIKYRIGVCQLLTPHFNFYFSFIAPHNRLPDAEISRTLDRVHISNRTFITVERAQATNRRFTRLAPLRHLSSRNEDAHVHVKYVVLLLFIMRA